MTRPFRFQPLDGEPSPYTRSVEDVCRVYPDMAVGEAMACVHLTGKIDWEDVNAIADRRGLVRRAAKRTESPQDARPTPEEKPDAHAQAPKPARRSKAKSNGFKNETELQAALLKALRQIPRTYWWRNSTGRKGGLTFGDVGSPDLLGILPGGRLCGIECKAPGGAVSHAQQKWQSRAKELGATVFVVTDLNDALDCVMKAIG